MEFFKPWMGQQTIWQNTEYAINSALIKRYLIEINVIKLPSEIILDELKNKESSPHQLTLIKSINPQELTKALLTPEYGFKFLNTVILTQSSEVVLALLNKIDNATINQLFNANPASSKIKFLELLCKNQSAVVCKTLIEKLSRQSNSHFHLHFKEFLIAHLKEAIQPQSFFTYVQTKYLIKSLIKNRIKIEIFCLIGLTFIVLTTLVLIAIPSILSAGIFPIIGACVAMIPAIVSMVLLMMLGADFFRIVINSLESIYKFYNLRQNLLNNVLALQSTRLLALFFSHLTSQQLKTLNFPLIDLQKRLPHLLFPPDRLVPPEIEDTFYQYWYSNSALRALLIDDKYPLLMHCIDDYFEGKLPKPHTKIILLFDECLAKKAKKQVLSDKERAFLKDIKQEEQVFPQKGLEEIWSCGIESWSYYRHLRQKEERTTQIVLDHLLLKDELFGGAWNYEDLTEYLHDLQLKQEQEQQKFFIAEKCIEANSGLVKVIRPNCWGFFVRQLENPNHRQFSSHRQISVNNMTMKFVHLTNEVIFYQKNRHPKPKANYTHTKKTSTTLLSSKLITPLHSSEGALLFDSRECQLKALMLSNANSHEHKWVGSPLNANNYKTSIQDVNETNKERFITKIHTSHSMNEVLAKLNKEALRAVIIQNNTLAERLQAIQRRDEIESKFSIHLPILFYKPKQALKIYTQKEQEQDQHHYEREHIPRGNRLWIKP